MDQVKFVEDSLKIFFLGPYLSTLSHLFLEVRQTFLVCFTLYKIRLSRSKEIAYVDKTIVWVKQQDNGFKHIISADYSLELSLKPLKYLEGTIEWYSDILGLELAIRFFQHICKIATLQGANW